MFFWVIVTCHAAWSHCVYSPQPDYNRCILQAEQINLNTDGIAICTVSKRSNEFAPKGWAIVEQRG